MTVPVVGDISERIGSSLDWRIPSWKSWLNRTYALAQSPTFKFRDATWMLETMYHSQKINVYVVRNTWNKDSQVVQFKLILRHCNGKEYKIAEDQFEFTKDKNQYKCCITEEFADKWAPGGNLTISCVLYKYRSIAIAGTQSISLNCTKEPIEDSAINETEICVDGKGKPEDFEQLSADFKDLFLSEEGSDVTLKVQDREFKVHKAILQARSNVFNSMFTHDMEENNSGFVNISDCLPEAFEDLLLYMYCGNVEKFSTNNVFGLYQAADKYDVTKLKEKCVHFMMDSLSMETFCDLFPLAVRHNETALIETAKEFFVNNEKQIIEGAQWLPFVQDYPVEAIELHKLTSGERNLF